MSHPPEPHPHAHDHGHGHGSEAALAEEEPVLSGNTERYELEDLFREEAPENQHFIKVAGIIILVVCLGLALAYPFTFLFD